MTPDNVSREVTALLEQREQYREFLVRLEERADKSNPRAYEKVRQDYEKKLHDLGLKLVKHVEAVQKALEDAEAAVTDLEVRRDAKAEEVEEAKLRRSVGEFGDEKEWKTVERKLTKELEDLEKQVAQKTSAVANLTEALEQIDREAKGDAKRAASPAAPDEREKTGRRVRTPGQQIVTETPIHGVKLPGFEEDPLGGLDLSPGPAKTGGKGKGGGGGSGGSGSGTDELEFLESLSLSPSAADDEQAKPPPKEVERQVGFLGGKKGKGRTETIICPRCSAANDPAEWYCVECGEELPAG